MRASEWPPLDATKHSAALLWSALTFGDRRSEVTHLQLQVLELLVLGVFAQHLVELFGEAARELLAVVARQVVVGRHVAVGALQADDSNVLQCEDRDEWGFRG